MQQLAGGTGVADGRGAAGTAAPADSAASRAPGTSAGALGPGLPHGRREAIVFVPGIAPQGMGPDQSVDGVARRMGSALDMRARTASAAFRAEVRELTYGPHDCYKARVATVFRRDGQKEEAVFDIFCMDYAGTLMGRFAKCGLLTKILLILWQFLSGIGLLHRSAGKTPREKAQLVWAGAILLALAGYLVMLLVAAIDIVSGAFASVPSASRSEGVRWLLTAAHAAQAWYAPWREPIREIVVVLTALGVVLPGNFRGVLSGFVTMFLCEFDYIRRGDRRNELVAQFEALIECTAEVDNVEYERTHVLAYSFGTLVATDALFRVGQEPPPLRFRRISTFVTIGFPFDLVRTYWPSYFLGRAALPPQPDGTLFPPGWLNIYAPLDIMGSNFRNDGNDGPAECGVQVAGPHRDKTKWLKRKPDDNLPYGGGREFLGSLRLRDYIRLVGFQAHGVYWSREDDPAIDCFSQVVEYLYQDRPALA